MAKGPRGETRPADAIKRAMHIVKIATGEIEDDVKPPSPKAKGGKARAAKLAPKKRKAIAKKAAKARWEKR
jgi:hypothetical protein